ncbi:MAG: phytoene/squalene synthase family protein [Bacteroidia bacterium]|nr:phytoene/squalene synthase family protein [Bacteroidia bacterium]
MKAIFDESSFKISKLVTNEYSTSFSIGIRLLHQSIRQEIYAIYGFVRYADEIVDSFGDYDQKDLLLNFIDDYYKAVDEGISLNPILNAFQKVVNQYKLHSLVASFLESMKMDLTKANYETIEEYKTYIYGSADVVGLMCLKVFVAGDEDTYNTLKPFAVKLGSAFQKVNFLRDLKDDIDLLGRSYFPGVDFSQLNENQKREIIEEIRQDFKVALEGIKKLPTNCRLGVYVAYKYYLNLLKKLALTNTHEILKNRVRIANYKKFYLLNKAIIRYKLNVL